MLQPKTVDWLTVEGQAHQKRGVDKGGEGAAGNSALKPAGSVPVRPVSEQTRFQGLHPLGEGSMDAISGWGGPTPENQQRRDETLEPQSARVGRVIKPSAVLHWIYL